MKPMVFVGMLKDFKPVTKPKQDASTSVGVRVVFEADGDLSMDDLKRLLKRGGALKVTVEPTQIEFAEKE